jgi:putative lipoprotein
MLPHLALLVALAAQPAPPGQHHAALQGPRRPADSWFGADKLKHFFIAAFIQSTSYGATRLTSADRSVSIGVAFGTTALFSVGKEIVDRRRQRHFSVRDLVWDAAGAGLSTVIIVRSSRR